MNYQISKVLEEFFNRAFAIIFFVIFLMLTELSNDKILNFAGAYVIGLLLYAFAKIIWITFKEK